MPPQRRATSSRLRRTQEVSSITLAEQDATVQKSNCEGNTSASNDFSSGAAAEAEQAQGRAAEAVTARHRGHKCRKPRKAKEAAGSIARPPKNGAAVQFMPGLNGTPYLHVVLDPAEGAEEAPEEGEEAASITETETDAAVQLVRDLEPWAMPLGGHDEVSVTGSNLTSILPFRLC